MEVRLATAIAMHDLTKVYHPAWRRPVKALDRLTLEVQEGETFGLVGPNGSGKTTALKLLLGLIFPTGGKVSLFNQSVFSNAAKRRVGFLPEGPYFYDYLSGEQVLDFYGRLFGMSGQARQQKIEELLQLVGMGEKRTVLLREYSRGMVQRIGLAQALLNDPALLVLDEPTSGLDPLISYHIRQLILQLKGQGKTILLCSHLLNEVEELCDRVAILHEGNLLAMGTIPELLAGGEKNLEQVFIRVVEGRAN